ncbi:hypothetical protein NDU88_007550 [Pleurodeles waltl]|uniref:Uncharacterized protein n=1 Tax=Pleurodeles waltl TaxID=8319 RepID=A0AAV7SSU0_PLEWA|nr:hypothetical protein NDU88_007550 [Pleurodeles waltl]
MSRVEALRSEEGIRSTKRRKKGERHEAVALWVSSSGYRDFSRKNKKDTAGGTLGVLLWVSRFLSKEQKGHSSK